jgi:hypothetical protein
LGIVKDVTLSGSSQRSKADTVATVILLVIGALLANSVTPHH